MRGAWKIVVVVALAAAVAGTFALRGARRAGDAASRQSRPAASVGPERVAPVAAPARPGAIAAPAPAAGPQAPGAAASPAAGATAGAVPAAKRGAADSPRTPRLLEVGSSRCMACQQMAQVLEQLRASQGSRLRVDFVDVFEEPDAAERVGVSLIPTQILYDASGKEIFRHQGFFSHDDILAKFRELGVAL